MPGGRWQNVYDELKNQWGWNGYTTRKLAPSRIMANLVALFYNWWNLYVRFFDEAHPPRSHHQPPRAHARRGAPRCKAADSAPIKVSLLHEYRGDIAVLASLTSQQLHQMSAITEPWSAREKWTLLLTRLLRHWLGGKWLPGLPEEAGLLLSG